MSQNHSVFDRQPISEGKSRSGDSHYLLECQYQEDHPVAGPIIDREVEAWEDSADHEELHNQLEHKHQSKCVLIPETHSEWPESMQAVHPEEHSSLHIQSDRKDFLLHCQWK